MLEWTLISVSVMHTRLPVLLRAFAHTRDLVIDLCWLEKASLRCCIADDSR